MSGSYYGRPIVKSHIWSAAIPLYFWIGGAAGAAAVQSAFARADGNVRLARTQQTVAFAGAVVAPVLLIADLGDPKRFAFMLRVFKPTSPMNVGSWILTAFGIAIGASVGGRVLGVPALESGAAAVAALFGPALTTYTAVLISDTATPCWHAAFGELPFVFVASGMGGAGALGTLFLDGDAARAARRSMIGGALAIVVATEAMDRRLGRLLGEPYRTGRGGTLRRTSTVCALLGAAVGVLSRGNRALERIAAAATIVGGVAERFAVLAAGKRSANDPKYTVIPQRARLAAREAEARPA
jgi:formate-dependent nitrite reductase membrane component NrfD